ncbi:MAG TPA: hypothetical protein VFD38_13995, partial [Myxococcaceae bacterium]|nr:hypothetical protein [Myxococcaceae bacterium]
YGLWFRTKWVTIHDTAVDGNAPFNANTAAKAAHGTPFKRPENGVFRPGSHFREFFLVETGDTDSTSPENGTGGGWTSLFRLVQRSADDDEGPDRAVLPEQERDGGRTGQRDLPLPGQAARGGGRR